jgi:hypothetical protein
LTGLINSTPLIVIYRLWKNGVNGYAPHSAADSAASCQVGC